jgi:hypothetical protein
MPATPASLWLFDREEAEAADALDDAAGQAGQRAVVDRAYRGAHARRGAQTPCGGRSEEQTAEALMSAKRSGKSTPRAGRRYGKAAGDKVERAMHEMKAGSLKSGRSGAKVTSRAQAIAIGLSEARRSGAKVPKPAPSRKGARSRKAR